MLRRLPPLKALKAFEAAARHESFTRAAEELCVTQGAVSHQVKALELELGVKLFNRERQRLIITEAGREYLTVLRDALDRIAVGTERLLQRQSSGVLTISTSPDFAAKWLVNRLGRFAEDHPTQRPARASVCGGAAPLQDLLGHLPEGDGDAPQDRRVPGLAARRSRQRPAPAQEARDGTPRSGSRQGIGQVSLSERVWPATSIPAPI